MFTYRLALLQALGIDYESVSESMVLRGKQYQRGPSFTKQEYLKAAEYCLTICMQGLTCILVEGFNEFTVWLHVQDSESVLTNQSSDSQTVSPNQQSSQRLPRKAADSKFQLMYRGVKYNNSPQKT